MNTLPMDLQPILDFAIRVGFAVTAAFATIVIITAVRAFLGVR